jgi:hypothetical protein
MNIQSVLKPAATIAALLLNRPGFGGGWLV